MPWTEDDNPDGGTSSVITNNYGGAIGTISNSSTGSVGNHTHTITGNTSSKGSPATNANLPPYWALCFIMKT